MHMYFSGSWPARDSVLTKELVLNDSFRLCTYAYPKEIHDYLAVAAELNKRCRILIDSGAFTAWNSGRPVQLAELLDYNKSLLEQYGDKHDFIFISLDVIPGERGRAATTAELKEGMKRSYENFLVMQQELSPHYVLPVYHSGEPESLRDLYLKHTDYICLSMNQSMSEKHRVEWAIRAQVPGIKMHGLAATGNSMMRYVDWYSVDSAAWLMTASMGSIYWLTPKGIRPITVSEKSSSIKQHNAHVETFTMSAEIKQEIERRGFTVQGLSERYQDRMLWNIRVWNQLNVVPTVLQQRGLFDD